MSLNSGYAGTLPVELALLVRMKRMRPLFDSFFQSIASKLNAW